MALVLEVVYIRLLHIKFIWKGHSFVSLLAKYF